MNILNNDKLNYLYNESYLAGMRSPLQPFSPVSPADSPTSPVSETAAHIDVPESSNTANNPSAPVEGGNIPRFSIIQQDQWPLQQIDSKIEVEGIFAHSDGRQYLSTDEYMNRQLP